MAILSKQGPDLQFVGRCQIALIPALGICENGDPHVRETFSPVCPDSEPNGLRSETDSTMPLTGGKKKIKKIPKAFKPQNFRGDGGWGIRIKVVLCLCI